LVFITMGTAGSRSDDIHAHYTLGKILGRGAFSVVKEGKRKSDGLLFAVKIIKMKTLKEDEILAVRAEIEIMYKLNHPNCVKLVEIFQSEKKNGKVYMVLEILDGGELFDRIVSKGSYSEKEASDVMAVMAGTLAHLHAQGIVHRDLKPENLMYADKTPTSLIKVTDFGLAKMVPHDGMTHQMHSACGTPGYVAPEVLKAEPGGYDSQCDMWSLGVILYILLCGFPPFYHEHTSELYRQIKKGQYDFPDPYWTDISASAKDLVRQLLTLDPKKRLTAVKMMDHPWIAEGKASTTKFRSQHTQLIAVIQARKILKRAVHMIIAANKFSNMFTKMIAANPALAE